MPRLATWCDIASERLLATAFDYLAPVMMVFFSTSNTAAVS